MSGRGLFDVLRDSPDSVHVVEDAEGIFRDRGALGVLRSALWAQGEPNRRGRLERPVTWTNHRRSHQFVFTGGVIVTANRALPPEPELDAIKTRIPVVHLVVADDEMEAMMRRISLAGHRRGRDEMTPSECLEVCGFLIGRCRRLARSPDLRTLVGAFSDFLQWRECESGSDWRDLVATRVRETPSTEEATRSPQERAARLQDEIDVARRIAGQTADRHERLRLWKEATGKSEPTLYRRLKESKDAGRDSQ